MSGRASWHKSSYPQRASRAGAALVPALISLSALGCQGPDVLVGHERDPVTGAPCAGADCATLPSTQTQTPSSDVARSCATQPIGVLEEAIRFGPPSSQTLTAVRVAPDGSVWSLTRGPSDENESLRLLHYSFLADGTPLAASADLAPYQEYTSFAGVLDVDAAGNVVVAVNSAYAPTASFDPDFHVKVYRFDAQFAPRGAPFEVGGIRDPQIVAGDADVFAIAGDAVDGMDHGVLTRFRGTVAEFVQTALPISGYAGQGVSSVAIHPDGQISVVSTRSRSRGGQGSQEIGAARFDADGQFLWDLKLPGAYEGGSHGVGKSTTGGNLVIVDVLDTMDETLAVRSISKTGTEDWAYLVPKGDWPAMAVDPTSSRIFVGTSRGVAVISADGQHCDQYLTPSGYYGPQVLSVSEPYLYFEDGTGSMSRARLPAAHDVP